MTGVCCCCSACGDTLVLHVRHQGSPCPSNRIYWPAFMWSVNSIQEGRGWQEDLDGWRRWILIGNWGGETLSLLWSPSFFRLSSSRGWGGSLSRFLAYYVLCLVTVLIPLLSCPRQRNEKGMLLKARCSVPITGWISQSLFWPLAEGHW